MVADFDAARASDCPPDEFLRRLRREFPVWGIVADTRRGVWLAVRGKALGGYTLQGRNGVELRERLLAATGDVRSHLHREN
jgi:hypothetical protein